MKYTHTHITYPENKIHTRKKLISRTHTWTKEKREIISPFNCPSIYPRSRMPCHSRKIEKFRKRENVPSGKATRREVTKIHRRLLTKELSNNTTDTHLAGVDVVNKLAERICMRVWHSHRRRISSRADPFRHREVLAPATWWHSETTRLNVPPCTVTIVHVQRLAQLVTSIHSPSLSLSLSCSLGDKQIHWE